MLAGVCVAASSMLVAAGRYSAGVATGSAGSNTLQKEGGKFYTCEIAEGTFQQRSCAPQYSNPIGY